MLKHFGVTPYIVFDGDRLPSKRATERARADRRREARSAGLEFLRVNKPSLAYQELQKAVDITPEMARTFMEALKAADVRYVVAPYEADAQMVYLERKGIVDGIVSEDSDLLVFGAACLLTKLDQFGECVMINRQYYTACREINLTGWQVRDLRTMAILSGCDYLEGINKMGLKTAHRLVRKYKTIDRILRGAMLEGKFRIPANYMQSFTQADNTFQYQWVFCPEAERLVHCTDLPQNVKAEDMPYIGAFVDAEIARQVAEGELNPMTKEPIIVTTRFKPQHKAPLNRSTTQPLSAKSIDSSKSIEAFFKKKRVPLAELDPNTMQPNPSQQQLLDDSQNQQSWSPSLAPTQAHLRPDPVRRSYSAPTRPPLTEPAPAKRRRLCEDSPSKSATQTERSKFFGGVSDGATKRVKRSKRASQFDFTIHSDDSVGDAMADLSSPQATKKLEIFRDKGPPAPPGTVSKQEGLTQTAPEPKPDVKALAEPKTTQPVEPDPFNTQAEDEPSPFTNALKSETQDLRARTSLSSFSLSKEHSSPPPTQDAGQASSLPTQTPLETPTKPSTAPPPASNSDIVYDSPPTQPSLHHFKFQTPSWVPEDSGYGSQLEALVPDVEGKGSEDLLVGVSSDDSRDLAQHSHDEGVEVRGSQIEGVSECGDSEDDGGVTPESDLRGFAFAA